ncbi:MAG TPA: hypothetical protein VNS57_00110 [Steroidobacteraceae bacterium]|nr:hypothetical protein [Steroidobacteraceae bacterium]
MTEQRDREIVEFLRRIEANQQQALAAQQEQLALVRSQMERSERTIAESVGLQRIAVARQSQVRNFVLPVVLLLVALLVYLLVRWRMFY